MADDDPAVAWFLSGVLRGEGATVSEACDGAVALRKAMEQGPDLVLSDVLMPNMDGLSLTETLRTDPLLSDVAVVLLSWKEDLLQRARELGARADAYLRKDASGPMVAQRVRELFHPRARLAERIAAGGEVHGRVDGFTMRTLLKLVCTHRPSGLLEVRDAAYLYEVEIEDGRPARVTRTAKDGTSVAGTLAFARLIGVRAGRFVVAAARGERAGDGALVGSLVEQIRPHAAAARGALKVLTGASLSSVARVGFDEDWLGGYGGLAPEPARALVRRLAAGEPPRRLLGSGLASGRLFEEVVRDAAGRGAISEITGLQGEDLLGPAVEASFALLLGQKPSAPPPAEIDESIPIEEVSPSGVIVAPAGIEGAAMMPAPGLLASATAEALAAPVEMSAVPSAAAPLSAGLGGLDGEVSAAPSAAQPRPAPPLLTLGSLTPPPIAPRIEPEALRAPVIKMPKKAAFVADEDEDESPPPRRAKRKSEARADTPEPPKAKATQSRVGVWVMCAVAGVVFAVGARISQDRRASGTSAPPPPPAAVAAASPPPPRPPPSPPRRRRRRRLSPPPPPPSRCPATRRATRCCRRRRRCARTRRSPPGKGCSRSSSGRPTRCRSTGSRRSRGRW